MNILAFDCSMTGCSSAIVLDGTRALAHGEAPSGIGQSEALMPLLEQTIREAGLGWRDLDLIGVTVGPGSFTGLRIGLSAARGLALALGIPVVGVATPSAIAGGIPLAERIAQRSILVAIDSKRADLFVQLFDSALMPLGPVTAMLPELAAQMTAEPPLLAGDGASRLTPVIPGAALSRAPTRPDPVVLAALAIKEFEAGSALPAQPIYLRAADVTMPGVAP